MGIDLGSVHTGIAFCDNNKFLAYPFCVIKEKNSKSLSQKISCIIEENKIELAILGFPKNMDGSIGPSAEYVMKFHNILSVYTTIEIKLWDERLTTVSAIKNFRYLNKKFKKFKNKIDSSAACFLLQSYLDHLNFNS